MLLPGPLTFCRGHFPSAGVREIIGSLSHSEQVTVKWTRTRRKYDLEIQKGWEVKRSRVTFLSACEGEDDCLAGFTMTELFYFLKMGAGLLVVYRWSIFLRAARSTAGSQLCESTFPHLLYPSFSPFFLPLFPPLLLHKRSSKK